ncbi:hypothetical protein AQB9606_02853 [Aquabacterium sp. CECT 9606]|nr:hypothetical protein AQB9606_02853 [Aquabacterium sp. CECT 9606]
MCPSGTLVLSAREPAKRGSEHAWLKRHALAKFCPDTLGELKDTARRKLKSGQKRKPIIMACWKQGELW